MRNGQVLVNSERFAEKCSREHKKMTYVLIFISSFLTHYSAFLFYNTAKILKSRKFHMHLDSGCNFLPENHTIHSPLRNPGSQTGELDLEFGFKFGGNDPSFAPNGLYNVKFTHFLVT